MELIALDIGDSRIGVARANSIARLPEPLKTLKNDSEFLTNLKELLEDNHTQIIIVGLPKNSSGQETAQTLKIRKFTDEFLRNLGRPIEFVDESYTSIEADMFIKNHKKKDFDQDSIAACYIMEEYLNSKGVK